VFAQKKIIVERNDIDEHIKNIVELNTVLLDCLYSVLCVFDKSAERRNVKVNLILCLHDVVVHMMIVFGVALIDLFSFVNTRWEREKKKKRIPISSIEEIY